jgi:YD repeat-containing protein
VSSRFAIAPRLRRLTPDSKATLRCCLLSFWLLLGSSVACAQTGLVGWWKFDEGTGTSAADSSGSGNTGTLLNGPTWTTGQIGAGALTFNGGTGEVAVSASSTLANLYATGLTVSAWIKPTGAGGGGAGRIVDKDNQGAGWFFSMSGPTVVKFVSDQDAKGVTSLVSSTPISLNTWQHVLATWTGTAGGKNMDIYINGVKSDGAITDGTGPEASDQATPLTIGNRQVDKARGFAGAIDDVRIYNRVLSASEIQALAASTLPSAPTGLAVSASSSSQVSLSWAASTSPISVTGYLIERCQGSGCTAFTQIATTATITYTDTSVSASTSYSYRVRARDSIYNLSAYSASSSIATGAALPPPTGSAYGYDELGRLTSVTYNNGMVVRYSLDAAGNRTQVTQILDTTPPGVPSPPSLTSTSSTEVDLSWPSVNDNAGGTGTAGYHVYRGDINSGNTPIATINSNAANTTITYKDTSVAGWKTYAYTVDAFDYGMNVSQKSSPAASIMTPDTINPNPPTLAVSPRSSSEVDLSWSGASDNESGLGGYIVHRTDLTTALATIGPVPVGTVPATTYQDLTVAGTQSYTYYVVAYDRATPTPNKASSNSVSIVTPDTLPPDVPVAPTASAVSGSEIDLSWPATTDRGGSGVGGYDVYRDGATKAIYTGPATTFHDTNLGGGTTHTYTVDAFDRASPTPNYSAQSAASSPVTLPGSIPSIPGMPVPGGIRTSLNWNERWAASTGPVAYYVLTRTSVDVETYTVTAPATSVAQTGNYGTSYDYTVKACNSSDQCSADSPTNTLTICYQGICP